MPVRFFANVLDAQLTYIRDTANKVYLLKTYDTSHGWTEVSANKLAEAAVDVNDFSGPEEISGSRRITFTGATGTITTSSAPGPGHDLHIALVKDTGGSEEVLVVTDENTDQSVSQDNTVTFPSFYMQANQPVEA